MYYLKDEKCLKIHSNSEKDTFFRIFRVGDLLADRFFQGHPSWSEETLEGMGWVERPRCHEGKVSFLGKRSPFPSSLAVSRLDFE